MAPVAPDLVPVVDAGAVETETSKTEKTLLKHQPLLPLLLPMLLSTL